MHIKHFIFQCLLLGLVPTFIAAELLPVQALQRLRDGNYRYVHEILEHPNRGLERRTELASTQNPFAVVLTCSDSRVSPEIIFDQGIGDLFVVRVAGNVVGPLELDSILYATIVLKASLVLVLGHENCGAVKATMEGNAELIQYVAKKIEPAVQGISLKDKNGLEIGIKQNVLAVASALKNTPVFAKMIENGTLSIATGYFQLKEGEVEFGMLKQVTGPLITPTERLNQTNGSDMLRP